MGVANLVHFAWVVSSTFLVQNVEVAAWSNKAEPIAAPGRDLLPVKVVSLVCFAFQVTIDNCGSQGT